MTLETDFQNSALETIAEFSAGKFTLRKLGTQVYDPATGSNTITNSDTTDLDMVKDEITSKSVYDQAYSMDHSVMLVAGLALDDVVPVTNDIVLDPDGTPHNVSKVETDQYGAVYTLYVKN